MPVPVRPKFMIRGMQLFLRFAAVISTGLFLFASITAAQDCPPKPIFGPGPGPQWEKWFVGSIAGHGVRMHLQAKGGTTKGEFYKLDDWKPIIVGGRARTNGELLLHDEQEDECERDECAGTAVLQVRLAANVLTGTWRASADAQPTSVRMHAEPAPRCSDLGPQHTFHDPAWPVTFAYPATWHVDASPETITLTCPDPDLMAYNGLDVTLTAGNVLPGGDLPETAGFARDAQGNWHHGAETDDETEPAVAEQRGGLMIVRSRSGSGERGYCREGGYVGQVDMYDALVVSGNRWVLIHGAGSMSEAVQPLVKTIAPGSELAANGQGWFFGRIVSLVEGELKVWAGYRGGAGRA